MDKIKYQIYRAIVERKWLEISYFNSNEETTRFYIGIKDIVPNKDLLYCNMFNASKFDSGKDLSQKEIRLKFSSIKFASVLDKTFFPTEKALLEKLNSNGEVFNYLEVDQLDNNILQYLSDCYKNDNDPYIKDSIIIDGIDIKELITNKIYKLNDEQFTKIVNDLFKTRKEGKLRYLSQDFAINNLSIDIDDKQYVIAYYSLSINFKNRTIKMAEHPTINKSFLLDGNRVSLSSYLDMDPNEFSIKYEDNKAEFTNMIRNNLDEDAGEVINTRPSLFLLERKSQSGVDVAFEAIATMDKENKLTYPLRSFFGRNRCRNNINNEVNIVVFDKKKINIDQMRVVYNTMQNHVTYVKGPPGTGKTETIFNVLLSAYANNKTVLICSNNNHPVDDIFEKMVNSIRRKSPNSDTLDIFDFPIIRLGNHDVMKNAVLRLRQYLDFANKHKKTHNRDDITQKSKNKSMDGFDELKHLLEEYETHVEYDEIIKRLNEFKVLSTSPSITKEIDTRLNNLKFKVSHEKAIENKDVTKCCISAAEDYNFQNYLYYSSISHLKKLLGSAYGDLRDIINKDNIDEAATSLSKYLKDDENLKKFLAAFPLVVSTNLSCDIFGSAKPHFDLCIMDEAGQCNIAGSLIPIVRAENLLLVGDTNQLQPVTVIEPTLNDNLKRRYSINDDYDYIKNSIISTMLRKDPNSKNILLRYHYRCARNIADFSNKRFYDSQLKLEKKDIGKLTYCNVKNHISTDERNSYPEEAEEIVNLIKKNKYKDVAIITPFVNQANLINNCLKEAGIDDVKAGTIHTLQGSEKSTIIMSAAISTKTAKKTMDWVKNNHELINVGITRAKDDFIFVGDKEAIDVLCKKDEEISDLKALSDYVRGNGKTIVPKSSKIILTDFSNNSKNESEFFKTLSPYFGNSRRKNIFKIERNVPVKKAIKHILNEDIDKIGNKEFDLIVQAKAPGSLFYKTVVVFEIDGGEHVGSKITALRDREKENICKHYGISLIRIANSQIKDYELIIRLFESIAKGIKDINNDSFTQISLFDE